MQPITVDLLALLKSTFQAGASGFRGKVICEGQTYYPMRMGFDKSLQSPAALFTATFTNENGEVGLAADAFPDNSLFTAHAWYGEDANTVQIFEGFVDKISEARDPKTVTITCRDWMKILIEQDIATTAPQGADETGTVRTTANFVYLGMEIDAIVNDLLNKAGWPAAKRLIQPTNFVVDEYLARDGSAYIDPLGELADIVAFHAFADELGFFRFQFDGKVDTVVDTDTPPEPVYTFRTGEDIISVNPTRDDYETKTRVKVTGPYTTVQDAWTELWHSNVIVNPTGVWYEPGDPTHLNVADGPLRKIYRITQGADAAIVSSRNLAGVITYLNGLSGDPSDALYYWTFDTPWILGLPATNNKVRKHLKSDNSVVATFTLANQQWTDMKVGTTAIWVTNFTTNQIHKLSKVDGSQLAAYSVPGHAKPIGVAIDGTDLFISFYAEATMLQVTTADPTTVVRTLVFSGTKSLGGDVDTDTHTELYACSGGLSLVYKYTLFEPVTTEVSVEAVNNELELALGVELDTGREIRRLRRDLKVVRSYAQAAEVAARWLDRIDQFRNLVDFGIIGNPAIQLGDMIRVEDPVIGIAADFQIDTYRAQLDDTFLGHLAVTPWTSSYAGPGTYFKTFMEIDATWKVLNVMGDTPPADWNDVGFDDSAWDYAFPASGGVYPANLVMGSEVGVPVVPSDEILLRKEFFVEEVDLTGADVALRYAADNGGRFYVNGVEIASLTPLFDGSDVTHHTTDHATTLPRSTFQAGLNCVAIYVTNDSAGTPGNVPPGATRGGIYIEMLRRA